MEYNELMDQDFDYHMNTGELSEYYEQAVRICAGCGREFIPDEDDEEFCIDCREEG